MADGATSLLFPVGGVNRRMAFQSQPPYTTPDAINVRSYDAETGRARGGSRPGLGRLFGNPAGGTSAGTVKAVTLTDNDFGAGNSELTSSTSIFPLDVAGSTIKFTASGARYTIYEYVDPDKVLVWGDVTSEGANAAFVLEAGSPVRLLAGVRYIPIPTGVVTIPGGNVNMEWYDNFVGTALGPVWSVTGGSFVVGDWQDILAASNAVVSYQQYFNEPHIDRGRGGVGGSP